MYNRVLFIGSKQTGLNILKSIVNVSADRVIGCLTIDDNEDSRGKKNEFYAFCNERNIGICLCNNNAELKKYILEYNPDLCIVSGWYYVISSELLHLVRGGFIGIHYSALPRYRGFAPVVWSIINGEKKVGFSVFSFDEGMDTGVVWYQEELEIQDDEYIEDVLSKLDERVCSFFDSSFLDILNGEISPKAQDTHEISYGAKRTKEDGRIDWALPAEKIKNFIRAQSRPYPGAFTLYNDMKITIWRASIYPYKVYGMPGQIVFVDKKNDVVIVVCGDSRGICIEDYECESDGNITNIIKSLSGRMS